MPSPSGAQAGIKARVASGAAWLGVTRALINLLSFANVFILARILTPADFGLAAIGASLLAIASSLTELSLASALVHQSELEEQHFHSVWTISLMKAAVIMVLFTALASPMADFYGDRRLVNVFIVSGLTGAMLSLPSPKLALRVRKMVFWQEFVIQVSQRVVTVVASLVTAWLTKSYWAIVLGTLAGAITNMVLSFVVSPYRPRIGLRYFRKLFAFSFWLSAGDTVNTLNWRLDQMVLGHFIPKAQLGIYSLADLVSGLPTREATTPITQALFPAFTTIAHDRERQAGAYLRAQGLLCAIAFPIGFGFGAVADPIVHLVLGAKWLGAIPIIQILAGTFAFQLLSSGLQPLAMSQGATRVLFNRDVRTFLIRVPFIAGGLWLDGLMGVVIARAIASFIGVVWNMQLVRQLSGIGVGRQFLSAWRPAVATGAMVLGLWVTRRALEGDALSDHYLLLSIGQILCGATIYIGTTVLLWLMAQKPAGSETEILGLLGKLRARVG